ncbi:cell adhesion molecule DSCAML1-like isoform X2 [Montipora foliosa]|uniref:cell adhesion molecule DSCAML1-like isoform X2 n=1 Tax=Montipora foliosa TaxID=591990 RepID=UPI0035F16048
MQKDFTICLVKCFLFSFLTCFMILKDASSSSGPQCEIICKLNDSAKDEETVDPDSKVPFNCSIENRGATTQNTTWKQLYRTVTPTDSQPCMVLKEGNSERQIYLARALTVARPGSPKIIHENIGKNLSCEFEGRPRPFITWYVDGKPIKSEFEELGHTELETSQDYGIFKVTSTLYLPGREKFNGLSFTCSGTNSLTSGWSSSANETISVRFKCKDVIKAIGPPQIEVNAFNNITLRCLVSRFAASWCLEGFTWHFNKNPEPLKTDGKYVIVKFEKIKSVCKKAFSLEILNVTEDDEGEYSCHQACRVFTGWNNQSDSFKMKVYSPPGTPGEWVIVNRSGSPKYISQNQGVDIYCAFKGRPRPQITWYKDDEPIINESESLRHEELEQSGEDGTLTTYTTLHVPGREEFDGVYKCAANSRFNNSWSTSKNFKIQVKFLCNKDTSIRANTPLEIKENALKNIALSCLVRWDANDRCQGFAWHFKNNSVSLKTDEKYKVVEFEETDSICYDAYKLEITNITGEDEGEYSCHQSCEDEVKGWLNSSVKIQLKVLSDISTTNDYTPASILKLTTVGGIFNTPQATSSEKWILATVIPIVGVLVFVLLAVTGCIKKRKPYIIFPRQCPRLLEVTEETAF